MVARPDLVHLDAGVQHGGDFADQFPEVHAPLGGEVERHLRPVKGPFGLDQLHRDVQQARSSLCRPGTLPPDAARPLPPLPVFRQRPAQDRRTGGGRVLVGDGARGRLDKAELQPRLALDDHGVIHCKFQRPRITGRDFPERLERHSDDNRHNLFSRAYDCLS